VIKHSRVLTPADVAQIRAELDAAGLGLNRSIADGAPDGRTLWSRVSRLPPEMQMAVGRVIRAIKLPPPPRAPGATVNVTLTIPADLADAYAPAEAAGAPRRAALLQRAMRAELLERGLPCPPAPPAPPPRVAAAAAARIERRERSRQ
jgi:hypothetical protein